MQNNIKLYKIDKISKKIGIKVEKYGNYKGKIPLSELNKFKKKYGNLEVGIARLSTSSEDIGIDFYSDIDISKVKDSYLYSDCDSKDRVDYIGAFCGLS